MSWLDARALAVSGTGPIHSSLAAPGSKSVTNRLLVVAALADGTSTLRFPLVSDDTERMRACIEALGARVTGDQDAWVVNGTAGALTASSDPLDCGLSGTTVRFVTALATLASGRSTVTGLAPLLRRPIGPLTAALQALGAQLTDNGGCPPILVEGGGLQGTAVRVDASDSSQFVTAVLLVAPYARTPVTIKAENLAAPGYVDLTADLMRSRGIDVSESWTVRPGTYTAAETVVEYDASTGAHLYAVAMATAGSVTISNANPTTQPSARMVNVYEQMGGRVERSGNELTVHGPAQLRAIDVDLSSMADQLPTVAALAALADGTTTIRGVGVTRGHETDRIAALATELGKLGIGVEEHPDDLIVHGGAPKPASLSTYHDHRMAMGFAPLALAVDGIVIEDPGCVVKTYPTYWDDLAAMGAALQIRP